MLTPLFSLEDALGYVARLKSPSSAALLLLAVLVLPCLAAAPPVMEFQDFADPQRMFERMFGPGDEAENEKLSRVHVSLKEEQALGRAVLDAYLEQLKQQRIRVVSQGRDVEYLRRLVETIRLHMKEAGRYRSIRVYLAKSGHCDARVFPGGTIVFHDGLLETAGSEAAVITIVGHELAHLDRGHLLKRVRRWKLAQESFAGRQARSPGDFFAAGINMLRLFTRPFQPEDELEADRDGAGWACRCGYDPREAGEMFLRMRGKRGGGPAFVVPFLQSHPEAESRHRAIVAVHDAFLNANPKPVLYIGKENLQRRVTRTEHAFPE